ncbi:MAG TPA: hypothetical protein DCX29_06850, partial [Hyphomonas sp.]|nr:hypothetical protein [Hyphomonas sp.]
RLVKRLIDLEIYRSISLLALPVVRMASDSLRELEGRAEAAVLDLSIVTREDLGGAI